MKKLFLKTLLLVAIFFISCSNEDEPADKGNAGSQSMQVLSGERMSVSDSLYQISDIGLVETDGSSFALITDTSGETPVHLVNVSEDAYISGLSRSGRGPGEFAQPFSLSISEGKFIVTDPRNSRLTHIPAEVFKDADMRDHSDFHTANVQFAGLPLNVHPVGSGRYLAVGPIRTNENRRFTLINPQEGSNSFIGSHDSFDSNVDPNSNQLANREYGTFSEERSMFATGKYHKDQIDIFDFEGGRITSYKGPDYEEFIFKTDGDRSLLDEQSNIVSYVDITSNSDYIYALYSGKNLDQSQRNFGAAVVVVDWDGEFIDSFQLDQQALTIAVDDQNSMLLAGVQTEGAGLYRYRINE